MTQTQRRDTETMADRWQRTKPANMSSTTRLLHSFRRIDPQCKFTSDDDALSDNLFGRLDLPLGHITTIGDRPMTTDNSSYDRAALDILSVMYRLNEEVVPDNEPLNDKLWTALFNQGFATTFEFAKALGPNWRDDWLPPSGAEYE